MMNTIVKKIYNILSILFILLLCSGLSLAESEMTMFIKDKKLENIPYHIESGELLAPVRPVLEELGGKVEWYGNLKVLRVLFDEENSYKLQIDQVWIQKPGGVVDYLIVPPRIIKGQAMIPVKYFAQEFGLSFKWNEALKVANIFKPANWVLDLNFSEDISGEKLVLTSTKKVPYKTYVLESPTRLVIDLKNSSLSTKSSNILWESYVFKSVRLAQFDEETVRVVVEVNNLVPYKIFDEESPEGFKIIIAFDPGIRDIQLTERGLSIKSSGEIGEYSLLELSNPERLVIDINGQTLQLRENVIKVDHSDIKQVRASQLSWDPKVVRLVLDLKDKMEYNILRGLTANEIIIQANSQRELKDSPDKPEKDNTNDNEEQSSTVTEFILVDKGDEYGDNEIVSIGITEGINQRVIIRTSTPVQYTAWHLPEPDRLVVDLKGAVLKLKEKNPPEGRGIIKKVRMHQYPDKVRIVFDLKNYSGHRIISKERTQQIEIGLGVNPLEGKIIVLDPGHGGSDPGAIGFGGLHEKNVTLNIGLKVKEMLKKAGATVIMTRDSDIYPTLGERVDLANQLNAHIFVSIHCNSFKGIDPGGTETFIPPSPRAKNLELAQAVHSSLVTAINLFDRGIKAEEFYVLNHTTMPAILVEVAFVSKEDEATLLKDENFLEKAATGIYNGIVEYFTQEIESGEGK